ncbi:hypothetical protein CYMTET_21440 [Cymbomonas tetramitiformis]|uniref:Aldehyde dehydrogenase domain-containing protein n=1 Tax=Cymbomonas tetramitiformis TaxID=36881 RepID=A0AAE0L2V8_9CHLO|nr:hypothetical protein CYMTET_21440 [Cymbomonas tetramitiformis]
MNLEKSGEYQLFIDNEYRSSESDRTISVLSPIDGKPFTSIPNASKTDVDDAVKSAKRCQVEGVWGSLDNLQNRMGVLRSLSQKLRREKEVFAEIETRDCGKTLDESRADMDFCIDVLDYYAEITPRLLEPKEVKVPDADVKSYIMKKPAGVVACITPWNYPLMQAVAKVAPAIAAGCSVILKPSPWASLTCLKLGQLAADAGVAKGALNIIAGGGGGGAEDGDCGAHLSNHHLIDRLSFTGSGRTGQALLHVGADHLRPTSLELGGKGALVVFEDADIAAAADWALVGIFACTGQVCSATSRLVVHESIAESVISRVVEEARKIKVGDPRCKDTQMGPLAFRGQYEKVLEAIQTAKDEGCHVAVGGSVPEVDPDIRDGYYVQPTILTNVPEESRTWKEEIFGPVLAIRTFKTEAEAVAMTNDTPYGLGHGVLSADTARAARVADALDAGIVWQNCNQALYPSTPFGGWKKSGFGWEYGEAGLEEYVRHKTVIAADPGYSWNIYVQSS